MANMNIPRPTTSSPEDNLTHFSESDAGRQFKDDDVVKVDFIEKKRIKGEENEGAAPEELELGHETPAFDFKPSIDKAMARLIATGGRIPERDNTRPEKNPFAVGKSVTVGRKFDKETGQYAFIDTTGWQVSGTTPQGEYIVTKQNGTLDGEQGTLTKTFRREELESWQGVEPTKDQLNAKIEDQERELKLAGEIIAKLGHDTLTYTNEAIKSTSSIKALAAEKPNTGDTSKEPGGIWGILRSIKEAAGKRWRARNQRKAAEHTQVSAEVDQDEAFASNESNYGDFDRKAELTATEESDNEILAEKAELKERRRLANRRLLEEAEQKEIDKARPERKINAREAMIYARAARVAKIRRKQARREKLRTGSNWTKSNTIRAGKSVWRFTKAAGRGAKGAVVGAVNGAITEARNPAGAHSANKK